MKPPKSAVKPCQASSETQVVAAATAETDQGVGGTDAASGQTPWRTWVEAARRPRTVGGAGTTPRDRERWCAAELLPHRLEPVARAERDRAPALLGQQSDASRPRGVGGAAPRVDVERRPRGAEPAWACIRRSTGRSCSLDVRRAPRPAARRAPASVSQPVSRRGGGSGWTTASASSSGPVLRSASRVVPGAAGLLAGGGDQPDGEAALAQVDRDRRGRRDRGLERGGDALAAVRDQRGCRGRAWPATARAAPRGAPSARRPGPSCASAPGAGRRRGGTRGP